MIKINYLILSVILLQSCGLPLNSENQEIVKGRQVVFNGKDVEGWEEVGDFEWKTEDDALFLTAKNSEEAFLLSKKNYKDFVFEAEFLAPQVKSGIAFRYNEDLPASIDIAGYLLSLDWNLDQQAPVGSIVHAARSMILDSVNTDDWQKIRIEAKGDHLKVFINDDLLSETHNRKRLEGKIALVAPREKGQTVGFRELILEEFPAKDSLPPMLEDAYRKTKSAAFEPLFPKDNFDGWDPIGDGSWQVNQGIVHGYSGGEGGFLVSEKSYKNFYLKFSFKIKKEDNSGVFIRKSPNRADVSLEDALECNIYDHNGFTHAYSTGSIVNQVRAWHGMIDYNDWNEMEIFAKDDHIVMYVNGEKSCDTHVSGTFNKSGNICLQAGIKVFSEDQGPSDIYFKDVMIKNMDEL